MLSFHNDPKIKDKYLDRVRKNGGAVGCTLEHKDSKRYPIELGLPVWLARLEEDIFNNLPVDKAKQWPLNFLKAIPIGVDVDAARHLIDIRRMDRLIIIQEKLLSKNEGAVKSAIVATISAIKIIKSCHDAALNKMGFDVTFEEAKAAALAAERKAWKQEADDLLEILSSLKGV